MIDLATAIVNPPFPGPANGIDPHPLLAGIGDWLQAVGAVPALYFLISYGIVRPLRKKYVPWWKDRVGTMIFMNSLALFAIGVVVTLSLFLGIGYPGRDIVRIVGYAIYALAALYLVFVYELEAHQAAPGKWTQVWEAKTGELREFEDRRNARNSKTP